MSRILFVMPGVPLALNHSGGASRYAQNFFALKNLGEELHVLRLCARDQLQSVLDFEHTSATAQAAKTSAAGWQDVSIMADAPQGRWDAARRLFFDPISFDFPFYKSTINQLATAIAEVAPDLLWLEDAGVVVAMGRLAPSLPWVYSSTDLHFLVRAIRHQNRRYFLDQISRNVEMRGIRRASLVVTGSLTEAAKLQKMGCQQVVTIPMANLDFPDLGPASLSDEMRIIHLGSLETTANRRGLTAYLSAAHGKTQQLCKAQLVIVGDASRTKSPLRELLRQQDIVTTGYVADLTTVLHPFDVAILPYPYDSGYRTKLPLLMGHAQVIVATRTAVAGSLLPGLEDVCILLDRVEDFPAKIAWLAANPAERKRLGLAARDFAKRYFSTEAVYPRYADVVRQVTTSGK